MNRKILKILIIITILITLKTNVYAETDGGADTIKYGSGTEDSGGSSGGGNNSGNGSGKPSEAEWSVSSGNKYGCTYYSSFNTGGSITTSLQGINGPISVSNLNNTKFKAGTWIGVNITENKWADWSIEKVVETYEIKRECTCEYSWTEPTTIPVYLGTMTKNLCNQKGGTRWYGKGEKRTERAACYKDEPSSDPKTDTSIFKEHYSITEGTIKSNSNKYCTKYSDVTKKVVSCKDTKEPAYGIQTLNECYDKANDELIAKSESFIADASASVEYIDGKKYPKKEAEKISTTILDTPIPTDSDSDCTGTKSGSCNNNFLYTVNNTCINLKTGEINYNKKCDADTEQELKEDNFWYYFIPLNAKSNSDFYVKILTTKFTAGHCIDIMEKYPNTYKDKIISINEKNGNYTFEGKYERDKTRIQNDKGCYISRKINFNIEQKFYNETDDHKLKGYNFYYRPIDINNPFPNSIDNNSYWNGIYNKNENTVKITDKKTVDLDDSFKTPTYDVDVSNIKKIRDYNDNEKNSYTNWDNMYLNGKSMFIKEYYEGYKIGKEEKDFYKLGCGPANEGRWHCQ